MRVWWCDSNVCVYCIPMYDPIVLFVHDDDDSAIINASRRGGDCCSGFGYLISTSCAQNVGTGFRATM